MNKFMCQGVLRDAPKVGTSKKTNLPWAMASIITTDASGRKSYVDVVAFAETAYKFEGRQKGEEILVSDATLSKALNKLTNTWEVKVYVNEVEFLDVIEPQPPQTIKQNVERVKAALAGAGPAVKAQGQREFLEESDIPF